MASQSAQRLRPILASFALFAAASVAFAAPQPTPLPELSYSEAFFPQVEVDALFPTQKSILGFDHAERAATAAEVLRCLEVWAKAAPDRLKLVEYARSHEGRPLHYAIVASPSLMGRLPSVQADLARLGDPRRTPPAEAEALIQKLPAVAWLAYNIHGDETEGADAALVVLQHLLSSRSDAVRRLLEQTIVIIDPLMNPDGRDRFVKMIAENRGTQPNVDEQSLVHSGYWPRGRGNHYLFDLNRDWALGVHPETVGRIRAIAAWNPQLLVDAHGMGAQDTHLFSPPRPPINPHLPASRARLQQVFSSEQAAAFDALGLVYYNGEWYEEWYPGYSDAWVQYRGAIGILYEQARIAENGVRRPEGRILSYRESVRHHVVGNWANLLTLQKHRTDLLRHLYETRCDALREDGPYAKRTFAILPSANKSRLETFVRRLRLQGIELYSLSSNLKVGEAVDRLGRTRKDVTLPVGTLLVPNRQPLGHLAAALLEFDTRLPDDVLRDERKELLEKNRSRMYDATTWSLTLFQDLDSYTLPIDLPQTAAPWQETRPAKEAQHPAKTSSGITPRLPVATFVNGADDRSIVAAARLLEQQVRVRIASKEATLDGAAYPRGTVVVTRIDNRTFAGDLSAVVDATLRELGLEAKPVYGGQGPGDAPDLGGEHFRLLERPRLALFARGNTDPINFGALWHLFDQELGIRHTHLAADTAADLARYNVLVMPPHRGDTYRGPALEALREWVRAGGTLIAIGEAAKPLIAEKAEFAKVRELGDTLGKLQDYELAVLREWIGNRGLYPNNEYTWSHTLPSTVLYPWQGAAASESPDEKEMRRRHAWQQPFMPQGALLAARTNERHWLTFGCGPYLPVTAMNQPVLMAAEGVEAPIRYGFLEVTDEKAAQSIARSPEGNSATEIKREAEATAETGSGASGRDRSSKNGKSAPRAGWCVQPPGTALHLRMSGLLWPEAAHRLAHSAWVTRESLGRGQIILFATNPAFRGTTPGMQRVLLNAIVCGPGFGTRTALHP